MQREDECADRARFAGEGEEDLAGDIVGEIAQDFDGPAREELAHVVFASVSMDDVQIGEALAQEIREAAVLFDDQTMRRAGEGKFGERAQSWSQFHPGIIRPDVELGDDPVGEVLIMEEILPEAFRRLHAELREADGWWSFNGRKHPTVRAGLATNIQHPILRFAWGRYPK